MDRYTLADLPRYAVGDTIQLVGAIYAGEGRVFLCPIPGDTETLSDYEFALLDMDAVEWEEFLRRTDLQEVKVTNGVAKAVLRKTQRQIEANVTWNCFRRDGYACAYCGRDDVPLTVDHLVRWEEGGPSTEANMLTACKKCNRTRGDKPYSEWLYHPYYLRVSEALTPDRRSANISLAATLDAIPRMSRVRSR